MDIGNDKGHLCGHAVQIFFAAFDPNSEMSFYLFNLKINCFLPISEKQNLPDKSKPHRPLISAGLRLLSPSIQQRKCIYNVLSGRRKQGRTLSAVAQKYLLHFKHAFFSPFPVVTFFSNARESCRQQPSSLPRAGSSCALSQRPWGKNSIWWYN